MVSFFSLLSSSSLPKILRYVSIHVLKLWAECRRLIRCRGCMQGGEEGGGACTKYQNVR